MRTQEEIQRAHDLLVGIILGEVSMPIRPEQKDLISAAASCLCWVLQHDHNHMLEHFLSQLQSELLKNGFVLEKEGSEHAPPNNACAA